MPNSDRIRLRVTNSFVVTVAILCLFCGTDGCTSILFSAFLHETAHILAVKGGGGEISEFCCGAGGFSIQSRFPCGRYRRELIALAAGALSNLIVGVMLVNIHTDNEYLYTLAGANIAVGLFNLVPAGCFDGGRILYLASEFLLGPQRAQTVCNSVSAVSAGVVTVGGLFLFVNSGYHVPVLITTLYLSFLLGYGIIDTWIGRLKRPQT